MVTQVTKTKRGRITRKENEGWKIQVDAVAYASRNLYYRARHNHGTTRISSTTLDFSVVQ